MQIAALKLTWFGAEGFPQRPSQGWLWYCCYGSPCKYKKKKTMLVNLCKYVSDYFNNHYYYLFWCLCVYVCVWRRDRVCLRLRSKSYVLILHLPLHSWKAFLDTWDVNTHTYAVSVTHRRAAEHLLKRRENMACVCACAPVCTCRQAAAWVCSQHLLGVREIVSECHIKIT